MGKKKMDGVSIENPSVKQTLAELESRLMHMIDEKIQTAFEQVGKVDIVDNPPLPPKEGPKGKRLKGEKKDIRALIDAVLWERLMQDCRDKHGNNISRTLDVILWRYFGKPKLSFEE